MLEVRDLVKVYQTKGGAPVRAIDGVSLRFAGTGMVFLLGKSGSGKSTLLNLCGGLDAPDEGEIVIKGRSSRDFTPADFDSYRNTYVGFVFQEYNLLEEFTVGENIALALELQGRSNDRASVRDILHEVGLDGFETRRPNTLSGGQRQRVAIARALVKNPEIIMADEPTGALDSETGRQVLETLRALSARKLVIVVSHDREFAERYGDRIIELKDGKVVSDVTRETRPAAAQGNICFADDGTLSVRSGSKLTQDDLDTINAFLAKTPGDVIITSDRQEIERIRTRHPDGAYETAFLATDQAAIPARTYDAKEQTLIRSRLPFPRALRIGASSMRAKPVRLIFTILLCVVAFTMFGLFSTITFFDRAETSLKTYRDLGYEELPLIKQYAVTHNYYTNTKIAEQDVTVHGTRFDDGDLARFREQFGADAYAVTDFRTPSGFRVRASSLRQGASDYYDCTITGFSPVDPASSFRERLVTDTDLAALTADDIVISTYLFDSLKFFGVPLDGYADIIGQELVIRNGLNPEVTLTVRGVYRSDLPARFDAIADDPEDTPSVRQLTQQLHLERRYGTYGVVLVSEDFCDTHAAALSSEAAGNSAKTVNRFPLGNSCGIYDAGGKHTGELASVNSLPLQDGAGIIPVVRLDGAPSDTPLKDGEAIVSLSYLADLLLPLIEEEAARISAAEGDDAARTWMQSVENAVRDVVAAPSGEMRDAALEVLFEAFGRIEDAFDPDVTLYDFSSGERGNTLRIVGFETTYLDDKQFLLSEHDFETVFYGSYDEDSDVHFVTDTTRYRESEDNRYERIVLPVPASNGALRAMLRGEGVPDETDAFYAVQTLVTYQIDATSEIIGKLEVIFLSVGIVMALFAMLLLFNFISASINGKRREIGILRAVGARSADVFRIFISEAALIALICYVLSVAVCLAVCALLNRFVAAVLPVTLFVFGPLSWLVMFAIAAVTSFAATFLPVRSAAKKRPVESIRAL